MAKFTHLIAAAVAAAILSGTPAIVQISNAAELPKPMSQLPKADNNAQLDMAIRKTNMAFEKIKGDKAFMEAVKSKNIPMVKGFLIKAGAPDAIKEIRFMHPTPGAQGIIIHIGGTCCPLELVITISF